MERYSAAPITSFDGPDAEGVRAEVHVIKGVGTPKVAYDSESGKSTKYAFDVDNTKYAPGGWVPGESEIDEVIKKAMADGVNLEFRIEKKRNGKLDKGDSRKLTMEEVAEIAKTDKQATIRNIAAVKREDEDKWTFSKFAVTNPAEDPRDNFSGGTSALDYTPEQLNAMTAKSAPAPAGNSSNYSSRYNSMYDADGSLNAGSFGAGAPVSMMIFFNEFLRDREIRYGDLPTAGIPAPSKLGYFAAVLTERASNIEKFITGSDLADLNSHSHSRARALIFEAVRMKGISAEILMTLKEEDKEETGASLTFEAWADIIQKTAAQLWKENLKIIEREASLNVKSEDLI